MTKKADPVLWGVHMGAHVRDVPVEKGYVAIGWSQLGDLRNYPASREGIKDALANTSPEIKPGAIPQNAGVLYRFAYEMKEGDYVLYPSKDRVVHVGRIVSGYIFVADDPHGNPNHRKVEWLGSFPRTDFSQSALHEIGSAVTMFAIRNHRNEFLAKIDVDAPNLKLIDFDRDEVDDDSVTESVSTQAAQTTEDFIVKQLHCKLDGYEFEEFVAHLLECMGYKARVTSKSGDGGVDIIAHKDELGFEPPIIKVQCKKSTSGNGEPEVNQLLGALGDGEYGLFVNLGTYSKSARILERNKSKLRLVDGEELVELILEHYSKIGPKYRAIIPMKQIYVPDL